MYGLINVSIIVLSEQRGNKKPHWPQSMSIGLTKSNSWQFHPFNDIIVQTGIYSNI